MQGGDNERFPDSWKHAIRDQIKTTKLVPLGLGNLSVSVARNGEWTRPGSLTHVIHDRSYCDSFWWIDQNRLVIDQWNCRIGRILGMIPKRSINSQKIIAKSNPFSVSPPWHFTRGNHILSNLDLTDFFQQ